MITSYYRKVLGCVVNKDSGLSWDQFGNKTGKLFFLFTFFLTDRFSPGRILRMEFSFPKLMISISQITDLIDFQAAT